MAEQNFKEALDESKKVNEDLEKELNVAYERFKKRKESLNIKVKLKYDNLKENNPLLIYNNLHRNLAILNLKL